MFSPVFGWECLLMIVMETRIRGEGNGVVFMALMF
jgi:hypothetical protein